ncbi:MAG: ribosome assembly factor SBDS [Nanoarchaeota archaeon]|nr:ribosome assembly factor SBDS [Nanoarchaeota archaeon]
MGISADKAVIAKITKGGEKFEILVDPVKALEVKAGKDVNIDELIVSREIYEDSHKGLRAPTDKVNKAFGTNDIKEIVYKIIKQGEVQLTTDQRREMIETTTKAVASIISKQGVNPQTGLPHPADRILRAMEQAKVKLTIEKKPEEQIESVLEAIQSVIPIKFEKIKLAVRIPPQFASKGSSIVRNFGKMIKEEWKNDGSYACMIEIPAGMQQDIYDRLNTLTHGQVEVKKC